MNNALPTMTRNQDLTRYLKTWQQKLNGLLTTPPTPKAPWNFRATNARGGIQLNWTALVNGVSVDGYQILRSSTGDFSSPEATINLLGSQQSSYFDALSTSAGAPTLKKYYKLRATAGTSQNPQTVIGLLTGVVSNTSISTIDNSTVPTTVQDTTTNDQTQKVAGFGTRLNPIIFNKINPGRAE